MPSGKVLIINARVVGAGNSNQSQRLLRNADIVFPTGIAFMAGDTFTIDHNYNQTISCVYGFEQDDRPRMRDSPARACCPGLSGITVNAASAP